MLIQCLFDVENFSKDQFYELDYQVMKHAFDIQNKLGRLYDESIYQNALAQRCRDAGLYREAIVHYLGGEEQLSGWIDVSDSGKSVGRQKLHLVAPTTALHISSTIRNVESYTKQLRRLVECSNLTRLLWLNFCRNDIYLITLKK